MSFYTPPGEDSDVREEVVDVTFIEDADPAKGAAQQSAISDPTGLYRAGFFLCILSTILGVALHISEYAKMANSKGFLANTDVMGPLMQAGMVFVIIGVLGSASFMLLMKKNTARTHKSRVIFTPAYLDLLHNAPWTSAHFNLTLTLTFAVAIDVMKPATIGFIMPGLLVEYGLTKVQGSILPTIAISGTVLGSLLWGYMADRIGRRFSLLLSTILFIATSICGAMPSFPTNIFMCWLMGMSVGGLIPVAISLMSETVPSRIRSKLLIIVLAVGSAAGYLFAAAANYLFTTFFAWRVLWFVGIPTGIVMFPFCFNIPESFRYLIVAGQLDEACQSMELYLNMKCTPEQLSEYFVLESIVQPAPPSPSATADVLPKSHEKLSFKALFRKYFGDNGETTVSLCCLSLAWGLCNYGFITYVPTMMTSQPMFHMNANLGSQLIFDSSAVACGFVPLYIWLYAYWSTRFATALFAFLELLVFIVFGGVYNAILSDKVKFCTWYVCLLVFSNALTAMLTVYSAECFSTNNRGKGTGFVSASAKLAGVCAPYFITNVITYGYLWQISVIVGVPLLVGASIFAKFARETRTFEPDAQDGESEVEMSERAPLNSKDAMEPTGESTERIVV